MPKRKRIGAVPLPINRLHVEVTNHCNFSCGFCPDSRMKRKRGSMDYTMLKSILRETADEGIAKLVLFHVMGEPLLYPGLTDAVGYATEKGLKTCLTTNGSLLTDKHLDALVDAGVGSIILSLQTPDKKTFEVRGAEGISYDEYRSRIHSIARKAMDGEGWDLTINFLSSPLKKLIFPAMPEISIADTATALRKHLISWVEYILNGTKFEKDIEQVRKKLRRVGSYHENRIRLSPNLTFKTRIMGDWAVHSLNSGIKAKIAYCPGIQDNFAILWNGDIVFCCVDYEGKTVVDNINDIPITDAIASSQMQKSVQGFNRFSVVHPHCQRCLGDNNYLNTFVRSIGSIIYFKGYRRVFPFKS